MHRRRCRWIPLNEAHVAEVESKTQVNNSPVRLLVQGGLDSRGPRKAKVAPNKEHLSLQSAALLLSTVPAGSISCQRV